MPHRTFRDPRGQQWEAWEVHPSAIERRLADDRRGGERKAAGRRHRRETRIVVDPQLAAGWVAFQSREERRRLAPIPTGWDQLPDADLIRLAERAESLGKPRRLLE
jgi:hypothetical protein